MKNSSKIRLTTAATVLVCLLPLAVSTYVSAADTRMPVIGAVVYAENCAACHRNGTDMDGVYPALMANDFVLGDPAEVVKTIVSGRGGMPAFIYYGQPIQVYWSDEGLTSEEIAKVASYIRSAWGNKAEEVSTDSVNEVIDSMASFKSFSK